MMDHEEEEGNNFTRRLLCIEYPGVVKNEDKMLETLGGLAGISRVVSEPGLRLGLKFRPEDRFCKAVFGHQVDSRGLLLKVKIKRKKNCDPTKLEESSTIISSVVLGCVDRSYVFETLCDFQYLPVEKNKEGKCESIYDAVIPNKMVTREWLNEPGPSFLIPSYFSRVDVPFPYSFRTEPKDSVDDSVKTLNLVIRNRKRRVGKAAYTSFANETVPSKPTLVAQKSYFPSMEPEIQKLKQLFQERPIWSKGAIAQMTSISDNLMRKIIHFVAYFYNDGPWRCMWVRFGYDPKKDSNSRIYQILTYRSVRSGLDNKVKAYRAGKTHHIPSKPSFPSHSGEKRLKENQRDFVFKPGCVPPMRFVHYQLCDIHLPEVKAMIERLPAPSPNDECNEKNGFLPPGFVDQVREILKKYVLMELSGTDVKNSSTNHDEINAGASTSQCVDNFADGSKDTFSSEEEEEDVEDVEDQYWE